MTGAPAWVRNGRADFLAANRLGRALYAPIFDSQVRPLNTARFAFLDLRAHDFYVDWDRTANDVVAVLRAEADRNPYDKGLIDLVGELSTRSEEFRTRWSAHNVRLHRTGTKQLRHPVVGRLDLTYDDFELPADRGLTMLVYTAEPASASQDALNLLASWAATEDRQEQADASPKPTAPDRPGRHCTEFRGGTWDCAEAAEHEGSGADVHR